MRSRKHASFHNLQSYVIWPAILLIAPMGCQKACQEEKLTDFKVHSVLMKDGNIVKHSAAFIPQSAISTQQLPVKEPIVTPPPPTPRSKVHPLLRARLDMLPPSQPERVVINFRDGITIPRFPDLVPNEPRESPANETLAARVDSLIQSIQQMRAGHYDTLQAQLGASVQILERYWLINGITAQLPLHYVDSLAQREDVLYIAPVDSREQPPHHDGNTNNDVEDARFQIGTDPYFATSGSTEYIGLLDTGLRSSHVLFQGSPSHIGVVRDCVGSTNCSAPYSANDPFNHGTSSASIISGYSSDATYAPYRGVTKFTVDVYNVYASTGLVVAAAVDAFEAALARFNRVIVAEMQALGNEYDSISQAADNAFDAGAVVLAANGNNDDPLGYNSTKSPAIAHKVIGVGAVSVVDGSRLSVQCYGGTYDLRYKPDLQAPSRTETASSESDMALKGPSTDPDYHYPNGFGGTSGALPYAAGAAALLRDWYKRASGDWSPDPGQIYAFLILAGQQNYQAGSSVVENGVGPIALSSSGQFHFGDVSIKQDSTVVSIKKDVAIEIVLPGPGTSPNSLQAALWWPENTSGHIDIDLEVRDQNGNLRASSYYPNSVFERAQVLGSPTLTPAAGWKIRILGHAVTGVQKVYWAAYFL